MSTRVMRAAPAIAFLAPALAALALGGVLFARGQPLVDGLPLPPELASALVWQSLLPRAVLALVCGAALGLAGALLQRVLRNPIADPSTLGIAAGAQLALAAATIAAPGLVALSRPAVAFAGGLGAVGLVVALGLRRGLDPVVVVLSGLVVTIVASTASATLVLMQGDYLFSLYIWGSGSLAQQNWDGVRAVAPALLLATPTAFLLLRPLAILSLDDATAKSLGVALGATRLAVIGLAVWLAATVTAEVGIIAFVGLAAPTFARSLGARRPAAVTAGAMLLGACLLSITDSAVQLLGNGFADLAPTGAATALLGGPLLFLLLLRLGHRTPPAATPAATRRAERPAQLLLAAAALLPVLSLIGLALGRGPAGWHVALGASFAELLPFRLPRLVAAGTAGAMLGAAGAVMQRLTGNPLAGPEVMGVTAGAGVGLAVVLFVAAPTPAAILAGLVAGALVALLIVLALSARSGFGPERMLLAGIGLGAFAMAIIATVLAQGDMRAYLLLLWMSGSTHRAGVVEAAAGLATVLLVVMPLFLATRWLDVIGLGEAAARSLGLGLRRSRLLLATAAAVLAAIASFLVGPLSLVGLIAPHLARSLGLARARPHLLGAVLIGAALMIGADWASRVVGFPYQVPVGLFAGLLGGVYLLLLLNREGKSHG